MSSDPKADRLGPDVICVDASGVARLLQVPTEELRQRDPCADDDVCLAFLPGGCRMENASGLVRWFREDVRLAAVALRRQTTDGRVLPSSCFAPTSGTLAARLLSGLANDRSALAFGPPLERFDYNRPLAVDVVHPWAWAVRLTDWRRLGGADPGLSWEYAVQDFVDRLVREGAEVFYVQDVTVCDVRTQDDPWCRPHRDLECLRGLFAYVRRRRGNAAARLFRWLFKPAFVVRLTLELPVRAVLWPWRRGCRESPKTLGDPASLCLFLTRDLIGFLMAG